MEPCPSRPIERCQGPDSPIKAIHLSFGCHDPYRRSTATPACWSSPEPWDPPLFCRPLRIGGLHLVASTQAARYASVAGAGACDTDQVPFLLVARIHRRPSDLSLLSYQRRDGGSAPVPADNRRTGVANIGGAAVGGSLAPVAGRLRSGVLRPQSGRRCWFSLYAFCLGALPGSLDRLSKLVVGDLCVSTTVRHLWPPCSRRCLRAPIRRDVPQPLDPAARRSDCPDGGSLSA